MVKTKNIEKNDTKFIAYFHLVAPFKVGPIILIFLHVVDWWYFSRMNNSMMMFDKVGKQFRPSGQNNNIVTCDMV